MRSLMYKNPYIYNLFIKIIHKKDLEKRYNIIAQMIGKNKSVLDVGCGTGRLAFFLDKSCSYKGIDLNKKFLSYAKNHNLDVKVGNVLNEECYPVCDVAVVCDLLHHVIPNHQRIIDICKRKAKTTIICEPVCHNNLLNHLMKKTGILFILRRLFGDSDGINNPENISKWIDNGGYDKNRILTFLKEESIKETIFTKKDIICVIKNENGDK